MRVISGFARGKVLTLPRNISIRPTTDRVKEALFNCLLGQVEGSRFLDLFAGSGGIGIEALSRGAAFVRFVEKDRKTADLIKKNLAACNFPNTSWQLDIMPVSRFFELSCGRSSYNIVFADPPYHFPETSWLITQLKKYCAPGGTAVLEHHANDPVCDIFYRQKKYGETMLSFYT